MHETWVYHMRRKEQHAVSQWGYWGVNFKCGLATSHTILDVCQEGQAVCAGCTSGRDAFKFNARITETAQPPTPVDLAFEVVGYIPAATDIEPVTLDDDDWE